MCYVVCDVLNQSPGSGHFAGPQLLVLVKHAVVDIFEHALVVNLPGSTGKIFEQSWGSAKGTF